MKTREGYNSEQLRNEALADVTENLTERQAAVYRCVLEFGPISTEEVAKIMDVYPNYITGRIKELRDLHLIEFASEGKSMRSNKSVSLWRVKKLDAQMMFNF